MGANIELIKRKKEKYGDSFKPLALAWGERIGVELAPKDVALLMADLKLSRLNNLKARYYAESDAKEIKSILWAIEDTTKDKEAYEWIANNIDIYNSF